MLNIASVMVLSRLQLVSSIAINRVGKYINTGSVSGFLPLHIMTSKTNVWLLENSHIPRAHTPDPYPPVYEGNPFIFGFWHVFRGSVGIFFGSMLNIFWGPRVYALKVPLFVFFNGTSDTNCVVIIFSQLPVSQCKTWPIFDTGTVL